jgi:putative copper export protein
MGFPPAVVGVIVRSLHVLAAVLLVGGLAFARLGLAPVAAGAEGILGRSLIRFRPLMVIVILASLASGVYNVWLAGGRSVEYHILFGIKVLLAIHVFAAALAAARVSSDEKRRARLLTGILITGTVVVVLGVVLRYV